MGSGYDTSFIFLSGMLTGKRELIFSTLPSIHLPPAGIRETLKKKKKRFQKKFPVFPMWLSKTVVKKGLHKVFWHMHFLCSYSFWSSASAKSQHSSYMPLWSHYKYILALSPFHKHLASYPDQDHKELSSHAVPEALRENPATPPASQPCRTEALPVTVLRITSFVPTSSTLSM